MNYKEIFESAQKELQSLRIAEATTQSKIDELVERLGLDASQPLKPQIDALRESYNKTKSECETNINNIIEKLKAL